MGASSAGVRPARCAIELPVLELVAFGRQLDRVVLDCFALLAHRNSLRFSEVLHRAEN